MFIVMTLKVSDENTRRFIRSRVWSSWCGISINVNVTQKLVNTCGM